MYMKKILVLSDSHGNVNNMVTAVRNTHPDQIIHLGDCWVDAEKLHQQFPMIMMEQVPVERILLIEGKRILICHGHTFNVKAGYLNLEYAAEERRVDAALFGHTHRVFYDKHNRISYMNPGSIGSPPYGVPASYGILQVDGSSNTIATDVIYME
jgi:putative phosphoesterase